MQTIATSPTSRRGVLIENLTAVSTTCTSDGKSMKLPDVQVKIKHRVKEVEANIAQADDLRQRLSDLVSYDLYDPKRIKFLGDEEGFLMYSPTMAGEDTPKILLGEPTTQSPQKDQETTQSPQKVQKPTLLILYGGPNEKSEIIKKITDDRDVRVVSTCEELDQLVYQRESFGQAEDLKLIVYDAKNCSDMVQLINAATEDGIPVNFMGVGLTDLLVKMHAKKFTRSLLSMLDSSTPGSSTLGSSTPGSCIFLRTDIETMIALVIDKAEEAAESSNTSTRVTRGMWVRLSTQELDTMMQHIDRRKRGAIDLDVDGDHEYDRRFHWVEVETQRNDNMETD